MKFDLSKYATVAERMAQLKVDYPDYRILTENLTTAEDRQTGTWVMKATLYLTDGDQAAGLAKATGHAFEVDGMGMANKTSALENAESSAIGRCLMVAGYAMSKDGLAGGSLASREEMEKVQRAEMPLIRNWATEASMMETLDDLRGLWMEAKAAKAPQKTLDLIQELADAKRDSNGERQGATGSSDAVNEAG